jgi:signal transduction histidine kinase
VRVSVADTGDGNYSDTWQRLFAAEVSYQSSAFVRQNIAEVVGRLGGSVMVESAEGHGSRIHVCFPAAIDVAPPPFSPAA